MLIASSLLNPFLPFDHRSRGVLGLIDRHYVLPLRLQDAAAETTNVAAEATSVAAEATNVVA